MYKFPYGIANFKTIREENYFYIDRTQKIRNIEKESKVLTFLRPRRSGKSLLINTLKNYYDINEKDNFEKLFFGLSIAKTPTESMGKYLILDFDFSEVSAHEDIDKVIESLGDYCNDCCMKFYKNYKHLLKDEIKIKPNFFSSLSSLFVCVSEANYKIYVLIDEYDNFINEIMVKGRHQDYEKLVTGEGIVKTFFKKLKANCTSVIDRIFITGISPVVLNDVSSGFNISEDITFKNGFNDLCGFSEPEIKEVLNNIVQTNKINQKSNDILKIMRKYYNGYCFSIITKQKIYNPTLSLYFLKNLQENGKMPEEMLDKNLQTDINKLDFLSRIELGREVIFEILENDNQINVGRVVMEFQLQDLLELEKQNKNYIVSLMLYFGLLTLKERQFNLVLEIPNDVCRKLYFEKLQNIITNRKLSTDLVQEEFFVNCNVEKVCEYLEENMLEALSNRDYMHVNELSYKLLFLTVLYRDDIYLIESERELFRNYCDLFFQVRPDMDRYGAKNILLEFKYIKLSELKMDGNILKTTKTKDLWKEPQVEEKCKEAMEQLNKYEKILNEKYLNMKINKMVIIGLGFDRILGKLL